MQQQVNAASLREAAARDPDNALGYYLQVGFRVFRVCLLQHFWGSADCACTCLARRSVLLCPRATECECLFSLQAIDKQIRKTCDVDVGKCLFCPRLLHCRQSCSIGSC